MMPGPSHLTKKCRKKAASGRERLVIPDRAHVAITVQDDDVRAHGGHVVRHACTAFDRTFSLFRVKR
jgi:hypothetical protein